MVQSGDPAKSLEKLRSIENRNLFRCYSRWGEQCDRGFRYQRKGEKASILKEIGSRRKHERPRYAELLK